MNIYDINVQTMKGEEVSLSEYKGKALLIVNTASKCGFTPQFETLEEVYKKYKDQDFEILGFPCNQFLHQDPGTDEEILSFCTLNYGVTFPMFHKIDVKGKNQSNLYKFLTEESPVRPGKKVKWNFEKFLINKQGEIVDRFLPNIKPLDIQDDIEKVL